MSELEEPSTLLPTQSCPVSQTTFELVSALNLCMKTLGDQTWWNKLDQVNLKLLLSCSSPCSLSSNWIISIKLNTKDRANAKKKNKQVLLLPLYWLYYVCLAHSISASTSCYVPWLYIPWFTSLTDSTSTDSAVGKSLGLSGGGGWGGVFVSSGTQWEMHRSRCFCSFCQHMEAVA